MARARYYSPQISRFLVSVLYHEARRRRIPMTKLTDELLRMQLAGSHGWKRAKKIKVAEKPAVYRPNSTR